MQKERSTSLIRNVCNSSFFRQMSSIVNDFSGTGFCVLFQNMGKWDCIFPDKHFKRQTFCDFIQSTGEGHKRCKMCHILMSIACSTGGPRKQQCHAGVWVLLSPILSEGNNDAVAVLSTCLFTSKVATKDVWQCVKNRGKQLGIKDFKGFKKAFESLPVLSDEQEKMVQGFLSAVSEAICETRIRTFLEEEIKRLNDKKNNKKIGRTLEQNLKAGRVKRANPKLKNDLFKNQAVSKNKAALLVESVASMICKNPGAPFSVAEIATVARITPNHFSTLFNKYKGKSYSEFLAEKRIDLAKDLLSDLTLNIGEVARQAGYDDPGYFARRFKLKTGMTPNEWRSS